MGNNIDLHVEYARVITMCEGTPVKPWRCVKYKGDLIFTEHPALLTSFDSRNYDFAVAIIEDTPVFVGDTVYYYRSMYSVYTITKTGYCCDSKSFDYDYGYFSSDDHWTLKPPEKLCYTITITGDEEKSYKFNDIEKRKEVERLLNQYAELLK